MEDKELFEYVFNLKQINMNECLELEKEFQVYEIDELKEKLREKIENDYPIKYMFEKEDIFEKKHNEYIDFIEKYKKYVTYYITKKLVERKLRILKKKGEKITTENIWEDLDNFRWIEDVDNINNNILSLERNIMRNYTTNQQQSYFNLKFNILNKNTDGLNNVNNTTLFGIEANSDSYYSSFAPVKYENTFQRDGFTIINKISNVIDNYVENNMDLKNAQNFDYKLDDFVKIKKENDNEKIDVNNFNEKNKSNYDAKNFGYILTDQSIINSQESINNNKTIDLNKIIEERENQLNNITNQTNQTNQINQTNQTNQLN